MTDLTFVKLWVLGVSKEAIAERANSTPAAVQQRASHLRKLGVNLPKRTGNMGRRNYTVDYLNDYIAKLGQ